MSDITPPTTHDAGEEGAGLFAEKDRVDRLGRIRQLVFGSLDGLLVPLGVVSGVAGGTGSTQAVIVAGIAEAFAGALSMGAGEFISAAPRRRCSRRRSLKSWPRSATSRSLS